METIRYRIIPGCNAGKYVVKFTIYNSCPTRTLEMASYLMMCNEFHVFLMDFDFNVKDGGVVLKVPETYECIGDIMKKMDDILTDLLRDMNPDRDSKIQG